MNNLPLETQKHLALLEVVDAVGDPVAVMREEAVHEQNLLHWRVSVILHDTQRRMLLQRTGNAQQQWGLPATSILAGEAKEYAAQQLIQNMFTLSGQNIHIIDQQYLYATDLNLPENIHLCVCRAAGIPSHIMDVVAQDPQYLLTDRDELRGLHQHFPELLSQQLLILIDKNIIKLYVGSR